MAAETVVKEERLYERLNLPIKINYEVLNRPHDIRKSTSKNISGGGICLSLSEKLLPNTRINLNIIIPKSGGKESGRRHVDNIENSKADYYDIKAKVAWSRKVEVSTQDEPTAYFDTGIQFLEDKPIIIGKIVSYFYGRQF